jgi:tetratricopeptide (TPR) repeat protein
MQSIGYKKLYCFFICLFSLSFSCATTSTYHQLGHKALEEERYNDAIRNLKLAIVDDIYDVEAIRDFGIAIYHKKKFNLAERFLKLSLMRRPNDPVIYYHLGLIYEESGEYEKAIKMYSRYVDVSPFNPLRDQIEGRIYVLINRKIKNEVELLLTQEKALDIISIPNNAIAVTHFANMTGEDQLDILQKGLVDMLITDLSQIKMLTVIERSKLNMLMNEMALTQTGLMQEDMAPRLGQLLGASHIINGTLIGLGGTDLQIDAGISHVKYGIQSKPEKVFGSLREFIKAEKDLVFAIVRKFGIKLSPEERKAIEELPTENMLAFMAYCRGLDLADQGRYAQARSHFNRAVKLDPNYIQAQSGIIKMEAVSNFNPEPPKPKMSKITKKGGGRFKSNKAKATQVDYNPAETAKKIKESTVSRLYRSADRVNPGFIPSVESRSPTTSDGASSLGTSAPIEIRIPIPVKP